jgi:hypothetical protein
VPIDLSSALQHLSAPVGPVPDVPGVPSHELTRSPAAAAVGRLAAAEGLRLYHFEHRVTLPTPEAWRPEGDDGALPEWVDGVLPEPKYGSFRHDLALGSFHPGHRAKWSAHELCHALVGFAWRPDATPLFHATAGRLAELVPVTLWYWLDEIGLRRCPLHEGPLFRTHCPACEQTAAVGPVPVEPERAERLLRHGRDFVSGELSAVERTRAHGVPCPHVWGSLDLCSDGVAYARSHGRRLDSSGFAAWMERYQVPGEGGWHRHLDDLVQRSLDVLSALCHGTELSSLGGTPERWVTADLAARLLQAVGGDEVAVRPLWDLLDAGDPQALVEGYVERAEALGAPHPADTFAVGYPWAGAGRGVDQLDEGLRSVVPVTMELADDAEVDLAAAFAEHDAPRRQALGQRFAAWLVGQGAEVLGGLAAYEAALRVARGDAQARVLGEGEGRRWADGVVHWQGPFDPVAFAEAVEEGSVEAWHDAEAPLGIGLSVPDEEATRLVVGRDGAGELVIAAVPPRLDEGVEAHLAELGLRVAVRWRV